MNQLKLIAIFLFLSCSMAYGQISTREEPASFRLDIPALRSSERTHKVMPLIDRNRVEQEDIDRVASGKPFRFGYNHKVDYTLDNSGEWTELPDGSKLWRLDISCPGALSINMMYNEFHLPDDAKLWIYSADRKSYIGAFTSANNKGDEKNILGFATSLVAGDRCILEYLLPKDAAETGVINVSNVIHGYRNMVAAGDVLSYSCSSCTGHVPVSSDYSDEGNAVALITYGGEALCSGALINNTKNDKQPLFLTAYHCYENSDAINFSKWTFYWHFDNSCFLNNTISTVGAKNLASSVFSVSDFLLLELIEDPFIEVKTGNLYYLGWDPIATVALVLITGKLIGPKAEHSLVLQVRRF